ncbi:MAG: SAVED domain-containing protein [Polyangiaceae bacterium]|nr:SAVED domain-containing protein [Polyangiaceae bacterium]
MPSLKLLFIAGSRHGSGGRGDIALDREYKVIRDSIKKSRHRDRIEVLQPSLSATRAELVRRLVEEEPDIVHIGGHGVDRHLRLPDDDGFPHDLSADDIVHVFKNMTKRSCLVVLNTCRSLSVAQQLAECVDAAIGTEANLHDDVAIQFTQIFYENIGNRLDMALSSDLIRMAFEVAKIGIENRPSESELPQLVLKAGPDIVLSMHPQTKGAWRNLGIAPPGVELYELHIDTPPSNWHITEPPDSMHWKRVASQLEEQIEKLERRSWRRIHVLVSAPYSLGAILGNKLFQRFGRGRAIAIYQYDAISKRWESWGPDRPEPIFPPQEALLIPTWSNKESAETGSAGAGISDVVVAVSITRQLAWDEIRLALGPIANAPTLDAAPQHIGQDAIRNAEMVEGAVRDIGKLLAEAAERYPGATIHFFFSGPVALILRAAEKVHLLAAKVIVYERICSDGKWRFFQGADLRTNRLFLGPDTSKGL